MNTEISTEKILEIFKKYKIQVVSVACVVVSLLILSLVVVPQIFAYFSTNSEIKKIKEEAASLQEKSTQLNNTDQNTLNKNLTTVSTILPDDPDIPSAMVAIQDLAVKSNLRVEAVNFLSTSNQAKNNSFGLEIRVSGPLTNLRAFLINLGTIPRIAEVETITMQKKDTQVEATIPIQVYYRRSSENPTAPTEINLTEEQKKLLVELSKLVPDNITTLPIVIDTSSVRLGKSDPFE